MNNFIKSSIYACATTAGILIIISAVLIYFSIINENYLLVIVNSSLMVVDGVLLGFNLFMLNMLKE